MQNKQFVETYNMESYDEELAKYHIAPLENRITRHVAAVKETLGAAILPIRRCDILKGRF